MGILTKKLPLLFCLIFMYLINFLIKAQPPYPFHICQNSSTYTPHSNYSRNLDAALSSLLDTNSGSGYFNSSVGQGPDTANTICLCRGDVEDNMCLSCLRDSIYRLRNTCPNQIEAVIYYEFCLLKYSNATILGSNDMKRDLYELKNDNTFDDTKQFNGFLKPFMNKLRGEAAAGSSFLMFAMGNTSGPDPYTLYGLMQCIPSLAEAQCNDCLEYAMNQSTSCCDGSAGVIVLMARCNIRYEIYEFTTNPASLMWPPSPAPSPVPQPTPSGGNIKTFLGGLIVGCLMLYITFFNFE